MALIRRHGHHGKTRCSLYERDTTLSLFLPNELWTPLAFVSFIPVFLTAWFRHLNPAPVVHTR